MRNSRWASTPVAAVAAVTAITAVVALTLSGCGAPTSGTTSGAASTPPATTAAALDDTLRAQLEAALDEGFEASGMPGVIVGVWTQDGEEWVAVRGVSELDGTQPIDHGDQSKVGSITKTIVGTVALQLIGEGEVGLSLDDTIDRWYPDFPLASEITIRMLMNMSSGIGPPGQAQIERICADPHSTITPDEMIAIGAATPREPYAPGEGNTYSGYNTFLLGRILEKTTGTELGTLIDERLLEPLDMTRSRFAPDGVLAEPLVHGYSEFCPQMPQPTDTTDWTNHEGWAAGAMLSTLDDLHRWGLALGEGYGLTPDMRAARIDDLAPGVSDAGYGYGLGVAVHRDPATGCLLDLNHSGAEPGYGAHVQYFEGSGAVFALIANGDGGTGEEFAKVLRPIVMALPPSIAATSSDACVE